MPGEDDLLARERRRINACLEEIVELYLKWSRFARRTTDPIKRAIAEENAADLRRDMFAFAARAEQLDAAPASSDLYH
jgi:hypothetical protein